MLALVTCRSAIDLDVDLSLLCREMPEARVVVWDDPAVDWSAFEAVIIRSTWDYHERRSDFLDWARHVGSSTCLWNPIELVEWNTDKRYLAELSREGIAVVPTEFVVVGESPSRWPDLSGDLVIKPSIGAGSNGVVRTRGDRQVALDHLMSVHAAGLTAMVQPYLAQIDQRGETGLVFLGGVFSHAIVKQAILAAPVVFEGGLYAEERIEAGTATRAEVALGERVVARLPRTAYARIDLLPTPDGPVVLEVEVTEPSLYLGFADGAPARAAAVFRSLAS